MVDNPFKTHQIQFQCYITPNSKGRHLDINQAERAASSPASVSSGESISVPLMWFGSKIRSAHF